MTARTSPEPAIPPWLPGWLAAGECGTNLVRAQLNDRHAEILRRHFPGVAPSVGLLADLADLVADYAQVAARETVAWQAAAEGALF